MVALPNRRLKTEDYPWKEMLGAKSVPTYFVHEWPAAIQTNLNLEDPDFFHLSSNFMNIILWYLKKYECYFSIKILLLRF